MEEKNYEKKQYQMAKISAIANVLMLVVVIACAAVLVPRVLGAIEQIDAVMADLEVVASELADSLPEMMDELDTLVNTSGQGIAEALEKISAIDIEALNNGIRDLQTVIEPLARFIR